MLPSLPGVQLLIYTVGTTEKLKHAFKSSGPEGKWGEERRGTEGRPASPPPASTGGCGGQPEAGSLVKLKHPTCSGEGWDSQPWGCGHKIVVQPMGL